jgi:hypothetical protein
MEFKIAKDKKLFWLQNKSWCEVELKPCFPNSDPNNFFSILDNEGNELTMLNSLEMLDEQNKKILNEYLSFKCFSFEVLGIYKIEDDFGLRHFEVKTSAGDKCFQMQLDEWPKVDEQGNVVFDDLYGEQYFIKNLEFGEKLLKPYL